MMGRWYKPQEFFKRFTRKKELRELCREKYGDDFVKMYGLRCLPRNMYGALVAMVERRGET